MRKKKGGEPWGADGVGCGEEGCQREGKEDSGVAAWSLTERDAGLPKGRGGRSRCMLYQRRLVNLLLWGC